MRIMDDLDVRSIFVFSEAEKNGTQRALFAIDGRRYGDSAAVRAAVTAAWDAMDERRNNGQMERRLVQLGTPALDLPTWERFRPTLAPTIWDLAIPAWTSWEEARTALQGRLDPATVGVLGRAMDLAIARHGAQRRPNGEPYVVHLLEVLRILVEGAGVTDRDTLVAAALHDVVEDTDGTLDELRMLFGDHVADLIRWLTKGEPAPGEEPENARIRYLRGLRDAPEKALRVKLADRLSNVQNIGTLPRITKQRSYARETLEWIVPLAERAPWFARRFSAWQQHYAPLFKDSSPGPDRGGHAERALIHQLHEKPNVMPIVSGTALAAEADRDVSEHHLSPRP